ncbi:MAG: glycosyl hydrolase family 28-related protein [Armatimonadota bacterium]
MIQKHLLICIAMLVIFLVTNSYGGGLKPKLLISGNEIIAASFIVNADKNGVTDATQAIQTAINTVANAKGGIVFLPVGKYRIEGNLNISNGVTLIGESASPDKTNARGETILLAYAGRGDTSKLPFIQAAPMSGLLNISIYYPEQTPDDIRPYPVTIKSTAGTLKNITLYNSYNAILLDPANTSIISGINGTCLERGIFAPESTEFSWMHDINISNDLWSNGYRKLTGKSMTSTQLDAVDKYTRSHLVGLELQRLDCMAIYHFKADDAMIPIRISKNPKYPHPVFGYGGVAADFNGTRDEQGWAPWYYTVRYANIDNIPEIKGKSYKFTNNPTVNKKVLPHLLDVTTAPYNAMGDGKSDDTLAFKKALSDAGVNGRTIVYVPQGKYRITSPLTVPSGVELRGPYGIVRSREYADSCSLFASVDSDMSDPENADAFITLSADSSIRGLTIVYQEQSHDVSKIKKYPYTIRGNGKNIRITDVTLVNSCYGIDLAKNKCDNHVVKDVWATAFFKGINIGGNSVGGKLERMAFTCGIMNEYGGFAEKMTDVEKKGVTDFIIQNSTSYLFGDCTKETSWGLVSFAPNIHYLFYKDKGEGSVNADLWHTMQDVGQKCNIFAENGRNINLIGYFGTGPMDVTGNWLEVGSGFTGPLNVYAKTTFRNLNHPMTFTNSQVRFYDEASLATGKSTSANETSPGSSPAYAVDRDPDTLWEAPENSYLQVDLGKNHTITGYGIQSANISVESAKNVELCELMISDNGVDYTSAGLLTSKPGGEAQAYAQPWADTPVTDPKTYMPTPPVTARYVRLYVRKPAIDGNIRITSFNVYGY